MIRESLSFNYAGVSSESMGITNINIDTGMQSEPFFAERSIEEIEIPGNETPYFQRVKSKPLSFAVSFMFNDKWDERKLREVRRWLKQDYYQPLWFEEEPERIYYALAVEDSTLIHNCLKQGYVTLTFRCDSPYAYSPAVETASITAGSFSLYNDGDDIVYPELWITTLGVGDVSIANTTTGKTTTFTGLANEEVVYLNCINETIISDVTPRYGAYNNIPLSLNIGLNNITLTGNATLVIKYQLKFL